MAGRGYIRRFAPIQQVLHGLSILLRSGGEQSSPSVAFIERSAKEHLSLGKTGPPQTISDRFVL